MDQDQTPGVRRVLTRLARRAGRVLKPRTMPAQSVLLLWLTALTVLLSLGSIRFPVYVPASATILVLLLGGFLLRMRTMLLLLAVATGGFAYASTNRPEGFVVSPGTVLLVVVIAVLVALFVRSRERLGLQGNRGDTMLVDLRDRLRSQSRVPPLPSGWHMEIELRPAFGDSFSGDFVVATAPTPDVLEVALVDVSGKGEQAGSRALQLSGAFGGLLGSVPAPDFLACANGYLLRQDWAEGFATAVHIRVDLGTGAYRVGNAGHPPAATGTGGQPWDLLDDDRGPALGLLGDMDYPGAEGVLAPGEAIVVYTDGLVEVPGADLADGIDVLVAQASLAGAGRWSPGAAARIVDAVRADESDDRALVLIWREEAVHNP